MNCPVCNIPLTMTDRLGVEIDYCTKCRGVWLDRGELDKIIERTSLETPARSNPDRQDNRHDRHYDKHHDSHNGGYYKKKKSFLHELFD